MAALEAIAEAEPSAVAGAEAAAGDVDQQEASHEDTQAPVEVALQPHADMVTMSVVESAPGVTTELTGETTLPQPAAEPEMLEVWRPGRAGRPERQEGRRRPRPKRREGSNAVAQSVPQTTGDSAAPATAAAADSSQPASQQPGAAPDQRPERHHRRRQRPDQRFDRPQRERDRPSGKPPRFERREREKAPDPNSPFAKLAALKAQLEADAKERS